MRFVFVAAISFSLASGCCCRDPSWVGEAPIQPDMPWQSVPALYAKPNLVYLPRLDEPCEPMTLDVILDVALRNNPATHRSWAQARAFAYAMRASKSELYPTVTLEESVTFNRTNSPAEEGDPASTDELDPAALTASATATPSYTQSLLQQLTVSYLLFDFGGKECRIEAARQALIAANWTHNRALQTVVIEVMRAYYSYLGFEGLVNAKDSDIKNAELTYEVAKAQHEVGVAPLLDQLLAGSNLSNVKLQREQLVAQFKNSQGELAKAMGLSADSVVIPAYTTKPPFEVVSDNVETLMEVAYAQRPDLAAAYAILQERKADYCNAKSKYWPYITVNTNANYVSFQHHSELNAWGNSATVQLTFPIFTGFLIENNIKKAREDFFAACADLKDQESVALLEVFSSYFAYKAASEALTYADEYVRYADAAYEVALASYRQGVGTITNLLAAQAALSNAKAQKIQTETAWIISIANLAYATGTI